MENHKKSSDLCSIFPLSNLYWAQSGLSVHAWLWSCSHQVLENQIPTPSAGDWQRAQQVSKCPFHPKLIHQILSITLDFWLNGLANILSHFRQAYSPVIGSAQQFFKSLKGQNLLVQDCSQNNWEQTRWYSLQAGWFLKRQVMLTSISFSSSPTG